MKIYIVTDGIEFKAFTHVSCTGLLPVEEQSDVWPHSVYRKQVKEALSLDLMDHDVCVAHVSSGALKEVS